MVLMGSKIGVMERERRGRVGRVLRSARAKGCLRGGRLASVVSWRFPWLGRHSVSREAFLLLDRPPQDRVAEHAGLRLGSVAGGVPASPWVHGGAEGPHSARRRQQGGGLGLACA